MHHETNPSPATPATRYGDPIYHPTAIHNPQMLPAEVPPGIELVTLPGGIRTLAYTHPQPAAPVPTAAVQPIPAWAKTTALLAPTVGGGIAAAGFGITYAAPGLIAMTDTLWAAAAAMTTLIAAPFLWRTTRGTSRQGAAPVQHVTQNITASGMFGRANGTINHR
ncbi:hypothetical protein ACWCQL_28540 [Streptomyces sp. NPDC002073]